MTKQEYQNNLISIFKSLIGREVFHNSFGLGKIIGVENKKCIVQYRRYEEKKVMSIEKFFNYHEPLLDIIDKIDVLRCEYELSQRKTITKKEDVVEDEKEVDNKVTFDDVIGLDNVKELINQMVVYPFKYKEIYKVFKRSSGGGILLYGAPGTGKTMIAKAIANEINAKFFSIQCSDIVSKWYGESEKKIKDLFCEARRYNRSIIFFDEFDSLGTNRENNNSNAVNRVVSELLAQMDGFEINKNTVLLIASTNKPWNIDSALLRSGRFNKKIYIDLPNEESRYNLLLHEMNGLPIDNVNYRFIAKKLDGYSSADVVEACNVTKDIAIKKSILQNKIIPITQNDFIESLSQVSSTIVKKELEKLKNFSLQEK